MLFGHVNEVLLVQLHFDACFKPKHLEKSGRRSNEAELDAQVPARIIMPDEQRDARDAVIKAQLGKLPVSSKTCNNFNADNADDGYACPLPQPHCSRTRA